jgi:hypothetical protein
VASSMVLPMPTRSIWLVKSSRLWMGAPFTATMMSPGVPVFGSAPRRPACSAGEPGDVRTVRWLRAPASGTQRAQLSGGRCPGRPRIFRMRR